MMRYVPLFLLAAGVACGRGESEPAAVGEQAAIAAIDTSRGAADASVIVRGGLAAAELKRLRAASTSYSDSVWRALLTVSVDGDSGTTPVAIAGRYAVSDTAIEFRPRFPLDAGRRYRVRFNPGLPAGAVTTATDRALVDTVLSLPAADQTPRTYVTAVYPGADTVPENLLRLYVEFSGRMSRTGALDHITLRDDRDRVVPNAFLPLDADFWNGEHTRYTVFLDPGRVKRGILPNEQMGRAIRVGQTYSIVIDSLWRDANGRVLTSSFRHRFTVSAPVERAIDLAAWRMTAPARDERAPLVVTFPAPLDFGLLTRALGVRTAKGDVIAGAVTLARDEREWRFTPDVPWRPGAYHLLVLSILEDPAGNRIDGPFEVDVFDCGRAHVAVCRAVDLTGGPVRERRRSAGTVRGPSRWPPAPGRRTAAPATGSPACRTPIGSGA